MMEALLVTSIVLIVFAYIGYPGSLYLLGLFKKKKVKKQIIYPSVTVIVTAHNEEARIRVKLENTVLLTYPKEKLQVIFASDGSTDQTNAIVKEYEKAGVELLSIADRRGKESAQKAAVERATGSVIVFTDAATRLEPEGLKKIVSNFADPSVGCVSSEDRLIGRDGNASGENFYVGYEMWLRRIESRASSIVGLSGSFFAARKEVCQDFSPEMQSDFRTVLNCIELGLRGVSDPQALGWYQDVSDENREFDRKVRTVVRGLTVFFRHLEFLNAFRYGVFSYQFLCHKLLRWLVPAFLFTALAANTLLAREADFFLGLLFLQAIFYGLAAWGWTRRESSPRIFIKIPLYFLTVNASILVAWWKYLRGQRLVMWTPSERRQ